MVTKPNRKAATKLDDYTAARTVWQLLGSIFLNAHLSARRPILTAYQRTRLLLSLGAIVCYAIFWWLSRQFDVPGEPGYGISLLLQPSVIGALVVVLVGLLAAVIAGTLIAGRVRYDAGLFCAGLGLMALTIRGGTLVDVLHQRAAASTYLILAAETVVLWLFVAAGSWVISRLRVIPFLRDPHLPLEVDAERVDWAWTTAHHIGAIVMQVVAMGLVVLLLSQSADKAQVLVAVFVGALAGTMLSGNYYTQLRLPAYTCAGPAVVAVIGYLWAWLSPVGLAIGHTDHALARPLPLDYLSAGSAGAILGAWAGLKYQIQILDSVVTMFTGKIREHRVVPPGAG